MVEQAVHQEELLLEEEPTLTIIKDPILSTKAEHQEAVVHRRSSHRRWEERGVGSLRHTNTATERTQTYRI